MFLKSGYLYSSKNFLYTINKSFVFSYLKLNSSFTLGRINYSQHSSFTSPLHPASLREGRKNSEDLPEPIVIFDLTENKDYLKSLKNKLKGKGGGASSYSILNTVNNKQYIGSAKDFFVRLNEHVKYQNNSNVALQSSIKKYGLDKFKFCIFEYFSYESKIISHKSLTELETYYIAKFEFQTLYNFSTLAHNNLGYIHTQEAKLKISKPGKLNPMYGKSHTKETKDLISQIMSKYPLGVEFMI